MERDMNPEEREEFERWNAENGYTEDDFIEFDMDDFEYKDGGYDINLEKYPELMERMENMENGELENDSDLMDEIENMEFNQEEIDEDDDDNELVDDTIHCLDFHTDAVISVGFSPNNNRLIASGGCDDLGYISNLSVEDYSPIALEGHTDSVSVYWSHDGKYLATAGLDALIKIWDEEGNLLQTLEGASESIEHMTWFNKGPLIVAGSGDALVWLWNAANGQMMGVFAGHDSPVERTAFSGDNKKMITSTNNCIKVWNPKDSTGSLLSMDGNTLNFHQDEEELISLTSHYERNIILSGGMERLCLINIDTGKVLWHIDQDGGIETSTFNEHFPVFVLGDLSGKVSVWDVNTLQQRVEMAHEESVIKVMNINNSHEFGSCSMDGTVRIWDPRNGEEVQKFQGNTDGILDMDITSDGTYVASGGEDFTVRIFDRRTEVEV